MFTVIPEWSVKNVEQFNKIVKEYNCTRCNFAIGSSELYKAFQSQISHIRRNNLAVTSNWMRYYEMPGKDSSRFMQLQLNTQITPVTYKYIVANMFGHP